MGAYHLAACAGDREQLKRPAAVQSFLAVLLRSQMALRRSE